MHITVVKRTRWAEALQNLGSKHFVMRILLTSFELDHSLRSLLVEHTVTAILAADLVASLQRDARIAFAAQIGDDRPIHRASGHTLGAKGILGAERGDLISFAGHGVRRWSVRGRLLDNDISLVKVSLEYKLGCG
jgi:hypothetical protein